MDARRITASLANLVESSCTTAFMKSFEKMHDEPIAVIEKSSTHSSPNRQPQDFMPRRINPRLLENPLHRQLDSRSDVRSGWMLESNTSGRWVFTARYIDDNTIGIGASKDQWAKSKAPVLPVRRCHLIF